MNATVEMRFDLKKPCADCPFRVGAPYHEGVLRDMVELHGGLEMGTMAHSCHKTDSRSDSEEGKRYTGPVQHCAGLLLMMYNDAEMLGQYQAVAWSDGRWKPMKMNRGIQVFKNLYEMMKHYLKGYEKKHGVNFLKEHLGEDYEKKANA